MRKEDTVAFIWSCTDDNCSLNDPRVTGLFRDYDNDNDGCVTKDEFVEFYRVSSVKKPEVVRSNIMSHNYTNDLKKITDLSHQNANKQILPWFILSNNSEYFELLFSLLEEKDEQIGIEAWDLI